MRKLEEFVFEKLKVTNNSGSIKTTVRKFIAWFVGEEEFRIDEFDIENRDFISSDKSMSKKDITDFLYKHMKDEIYVDEEEKRARTESRSALYNYSFDIEGITFSIDARIYNDNELLSNSTDYIIEKLKVGKQGSDMLKVELRDFVTWYMYDNPHWNASDLKTVNFAQDTANKYFNGSYNSLYEFINKHSQDVIYVYEEKLNEPKRYMYSFDVDGIPFSVEAYIENDSELLSNQFRILLEKLKVTKKSSSGNIKSTMKKFFLWYWDSESVNNYFWEAMYTVEFENNVIEENFNDMKEFLDWFETHMDDIVYFDEVKVNKATYTYTFECDGIEFVIEAWLSTISTPFSKD